jgi:hypothetical protein
MKPLEREPSALPRASRARRLMAVGRRGSVLVTIAMLGSCSVAEDFLDPVHAQAVSALGPETFGLDKGPTHRPGQPCLTCHGGQGPGSPDLSVAGTVYKTQTAADWLGGATVTLTDATGTSRRPTTNRTGNFLVTAGEWTPVYPMRVSVSFSGVSVDMLTHVGRSGSCADCHTDPASPASAGHVYLVVEPSDFPGAP